MIAEAGDWLADAGRARRADAMRSIMATLERRQRVAACRAPDRPVDV